MALCWWVWALAPACAKNAAAPDAAGGAGHPSLAGRVWAAPPGAALPDAAAALALHRRGGFQSLQGNLARGYTPDVIWLAAELPADASQPRDMVLEVGPAYLDRVTAYQVQADGALRLLGVSGDQVPRAARALLSLVPAFAVQLPAGQDTTVLLRIDTVSTKSAMLALYSTRSYAAAQLVNGLLLGGIFAVSLSMLFLAVGVWLLYRQRSFLLWAAYMTATACLWFMLDGLASVLLPDDKLHWVNIATSVLNLLSLVLGTLFMRSIFEVRKLSRPLHSALGGAALALPALFVASTLAGAKTPAQLLLVASLPLFALVGAAIVWQMLRRERVGLVYGPAFLLFLTASLHNILATLGWWPLDRLSYYGWQVAGFLNLLSLQVAVLAKARQARRQLDQERARLAHELTQRNAELEQRVEARTSTLEAALREVQSAQAQDRELLSMVSHEFRTPAAVIKASLDSLELLPDKPPPQVSSRLANIRAASQRMIQLADDVITHDRLSEPALAMHHVVMDLRELLQQVARHYPAAAPLAWQLPPQPVPVRLDAALIGIALTNLVDNALRYHPASAATPVLVTLRLLPASAPTTAQVEVSDRGPGIPKAAKPRIFERFFVVERDDQDDPAQRRLSTGRASRSHGLGLAIVRSIVLAHGGSVAVRDHPQQGAVFTLDLPLAPPAADKAPAPLPA